MPSGSGELKDYVGRIWATEDTVTAIQIAKMSATLNRDDPPLDPGDAIPFGWHSVYFPRLHPTRDLPRDGMVPEIEDGPENPLPNRMYTGNNMRFHAPLRIGQTATKEMELLSVVPKEGRSGPLVFVNFGLRISGPDGLSTEDEINFVFREPDKSGGPPPPGKPGPTEATWKRQVSADMVMLFRFSAVTFNPHRIHYDHRYVTEVEGYPAILVHGPLTAIWLMELAREKNPGAVMKSFTQRARAPVFVNEQVTVLGEPSADGKSCELWAVKEDGTLAMQV
ncbi:MAG: acyl-CoA dehydrogenase, partial [Rhodospirillales bacterium]|nr:acyl-CoA dehydrogenase [Rhodospirillales bacterium]